MNSIRNLLNSYPFLWLVLSLPGIALSVGFFKGSATPEQLLHPTGEFSARFMILAMMLTPLLMVFPGSRVLTWLNKRRRAFGVAAFGYALLHLLYYVIDMQTLAAMVDEFWALGIWTGWLAFVIFLPLAITSNDASMRILKHTWKRIHRWVYVAAVLTLAHWIFVHNNLVPALVHFVPLLLLEIYRLSRLSQRTPTS